MINDCQNAGTLTLGFHIGNVSSVKLLPVVVFVCLGALGVLAAQSQVNDQSTGAAEWPTGSFDQQRDGWQRNETRLTVDNAKNIRLLWKLKTDNKSMGMQSFREPIIVAGVHTAGGVKTLAILGGSSNAVYAVDVDNGSLVWQKNLKWSSDRPQEPGQGEGFICNNGLTATPVVTPAGSGQRFVYVLANDGYLHTMDPATGDENDAPIQMVPGIYGKPNGLNLVNNVVYTATGQGCHGVLNEMYAVDLTTKKAFHTSPQGGIFGTAGRRHRQRRNHLFRDRRRALRRSRGKIVHQRAGLHFSRRYLDPQGLLHAQQPRVADQARPGHEHHPGRLSLTRDETCWLAPGKEGRYFLMDSKSLGGPDHQTPLYRSPLLSNKNVNFQTEGTWGSFASWEGKDGTRWVLAPIGGPVAVDFPISYGPTPNGGVIALKLRETGGKMELTPAWLSRDMMSAEPPVVANGVVFVLAAGEFTGQANDEDGGLYSFEDRIKHSIPAKLYALDATTGKELYSSGDQIASFLHQAGIALAGGRVIFGTFDGTIYCFGLE